MLVLKQKEQRALVTKSYFFSQKMHKKFVDKNQVFVFTPKKDI